jgi:class 3 adenylate cyclase
MTQTLNGATTGWPQWAAGVQSGDNDYLWQVLFAGPEPGAALHRVVFAGQPDQDPAALRNYLLHKQADADAVAGALDHERCVFCRHPFGAKYHDPFFGPIEIRRNRLNRFYCNQCDFFIRVCPGLATLTMPVLVVDVRRSRTIRAEVGDLRHYAQLLLGFRQQVVAEVQRNFGFVLNAVGDAVVAVWPPGFMPPHLEQDVPAPPVVTAARCAVDAAAALASIAPAEFTGQALPFRGTVDTTEMVIFAVTATDDDNPFAALSDDDVGESPPVDAGAAAVDIAGEAVEVACELASHPDAAAGHIFVTRRTDVRAELPQVSTSYFCLGDGSVSMRFV